MRRATVILDLPAATGAAWGWSFYGKSTADTNYAGYRVMVWNSWWMRPKATVQPQEITLLIRTFAAAVTKCTQASEVHVNEESLMLSAKYQTPSPGVE